MHPCLLHSNPQSFGNIFFTEAYDKLQANLITAKESLTKILTSKDLKATVRATLFTLQASYFVIVCIIDCSNELMFTMQLLDMVERNELNRSLLTLLDENIANAHKGNQVIAIGNSCHWVVEKS